MDTSQITTLFTNDNERVFDPEAITISITAKTHIGKTHLGLEILRLLKKEHDVNVRTFDCDDRPQHSVHAIESGNTKEVCKFIKEKGIAIDIVEDYIHPAEKDTPARRRVRYVKNMDNNVEVLNKATIDIVALSKNPEDFTSDKIAAILVKYSNSLRRS